eukprot:scaffold1493_cov66-Phaeocystis_antarctica.AAC.1
MVEVTVDGALPRKKAACAQTSWSTSSTCSAGAERDAVRAHWRLEELGARRVRGEVDVAEAQPRHRGEDGGAHL